MKSHYELPPLLKELFQLSERYKDYVCNDKFKCVSCAFHNTNKCPIQNDPDYEEDSDVEIGDSLDCIMYWEPLISARWNSIWNETLRQ